MSATLAPMGNLNERLKSNMATAAIRRKIKFVCKILKSDSHLPKKIIFICFNESPLKMMKKAFYFILKARFVLKIFKFLS